MVTMNSQGNEEQLIRRYFGNRKGTFLDIGANDGKTLSNVYACAKRGWSGVCVEPSPQAFVRLEANMSIFGDRVQCLQYAIADKAGTMTLYESGPHLSGNDVALLSSLDEAQTHKWKEQFTPVEVQAVTFAMMLKMTDVQRFNLVSIDAEGVDLDILKQMDLDALAVEMVIIEHEHGDEIAMREYCEAFGMRQYGRNRQNLIMVR